MLGFEYFWNGITKKYVDFGGSATRKEYWLYTLWNTIIVLFIYVLFAMEALKAPNENDDITSLGLVYLMILMVYVLATFIPNIAITVRRFHDAGFSGLFYLLSFVPLLGGLIVFVFMLLPSVKDNNPYLEGLKSDSSSVDINSLKQEVANLKNKVEIANLKKEIDELKTKI